VSRRPNLPISRSEFERLIPYISNGPLVFWLYPVFGVGGASWFLANTVEGFNNTIRRAYIGVWHYWSPQHGQRYVEELAFRAGQRQVVRTKRTIRGKSKTRLVSELPFPTIRFVQTCGADSRDAGCL
jgi:ISXO2-like transposase domain